MTAGIRPALSLGAASDDQVPRLAAFRGAYPLVRIYTMGDRGAWQAWIPDREASAAGKVITCWHLRDLLDDLARLLGEPGPEDAEIVRLYQSGLSTLSAARMTSASTRRVRAAVLRAGVMRSRPRRVISDETARDITEACTSGGMTARQAAASFAMPVKAVGRILEQRLPLPGEAGELLSPGTAARNAGTTTAYLSALARAEKLRSVRRTAHGYRWYYEDDIEALAAGRGRGRA